MALALSVRQDLTWRDVQGLVVHSAIPFNPKDSSWQRNGAGLHYSHRFGFGKLDAFLVVERAKAWKLMGPLVAVALPEQTVGSGALSAAGLSLDLEVSEADVQQALEPVFPHEGQAQGSPDEPRRLFRIQNVAVTVDIKHDKRGDILVWLTSPSGTVAQLATERPRDESKDPLSGWTFTTVACWGEEAPGKWTLQVAHSKTSQGQGAIAKWSLALYGEGSATPFLPIPPSSAFGLNIVEDAGVNILVTEELNLRTRRSEVVLMGTIVGIATLFVSLGWVMVMRYLRAQPSTVRK